MVTQDNSILDNLVKSYFEPNLKQSDSTPNIVVVPMQESKFRLDEDKLKAETIPNAESLEGLPAIGIKKIHPIMVPRMLFMHPAVPRGVEIKANRMVRLLDSDLQSNILPNPNGSKKADEAREYCIKVLQDSGGPILCKKMIQGAFNYGTSFMLHQLNDNKDQVMRLKHMDEIYFGPALWPMGKTDVRWGNMPIGERQVLAGRRKIDLKTGEISYYSQYKKKVNDSSSYGSNYNITNDEYVDIENDPTLRKDLTPQMLVPFGKEFGKNFVTQLMFDSIGDDPLGISIFQTLQCQIQYLVDMERAGAQTQVNFGFNRWVANTPFKDVKKMKEFAKTLANIQKHSVVVLPDGITLKNIEPGNSNFEKIHPIYMELVAIRLGIPMSLLFMKGTDSNKATLRSQVSEMYEDFFADERVFEQSMDDALWKMCSIKYSDLTHEKLEEIVPRFRFNMPKENVDLVHDRILKRTLSIRNLAMSAKQLSELMTDNSKSAIESINQEIIDILSSKTKQIENVKSKKVDNQLDAKTKNEK